jgi:hypothetical protein
MGNGDWPRHDSRETLMQRTDTLTVALAMALSLALTGTLAAQGGKPPKLTPYALSVTVEQMPTVDAPGIFGDGLPYVHGDADGSEATFDQYGNLIIRFGRPITFQYTDPQLGAVPVPSGMFDGSFVSTLRRTGEGPLQALAVASSQCVKMNWQYDRGEGGWWRHGFNRGFDSAMQDDTSHAVVTRVDPTTWTVEPASNTSCSGAPTYLELDAVASVFTQVPDHRKWELVSYGYYRLPFRMTLTKLP